MSRYALIKAGQEVGDLMREGVFIADLQTWYPPVAHVGLIAIGYVDTAPTANNRLIGVIEVLQAVKIVQVPLEACVFAVDLKRVEGLVAARVTCRFKQPERTVGEVAKERTGVIDTNRLLLASFSVNAFLTNVSVIAVTFLIDPLSQMAESMQ